ncbi:hypothetical protein DFJ73DRAFT_15050 [Zopfochytrium polystomum]|nr:hypothetical protein DFJ73DRAFT_15050 [Zopfochytrium polystomum]
MVGGGCVGGVGGDECATATIDPPLTHDEIRRRRGNGGLWGPKPPFCFRFFFFFVIAVVIPHTLSFSQSCLSVSDLVLANFLFFFLSFFFSRSARLVVSLCFLFV